MTQEEADPFNGGQILGRDSAMNEAMGLPTQRSWEAEDKVLSLSRRCAAWNSEADTPRSPTTLSRGDIVLFLSHRSQPEKGFSFLK